MLTARDNLLRVFRHELPDWTPVTAHVDPYNQPSRRGMAPGLAATLGSVEWGDESTVAFSRYLGLDVMDFYIPPITVRQRTIVVDSAREGDCQVTTWRTPRGDLRQVTRFSPDTGMWYTVEHQVKTVSDLPLLAAIFDDQEITLDEEQVAALKARHQLIGDDGILICALPGTPLGQLIRVHAGVEHVGYLWADGPDELQALVDVMTENHLRQFRLAASCPGIDALVGMDDTSTTTQSPAMFEEYCLPYTDRVADAAHAGGKWYFHHSCGLIRDLLPLYRQTRMDAVHGYTITPVGDVTVAEGRSLLGPRITIIAGFVQLFGNMDDREAVEESVAAMFRGAAPGDHFIGTVAADPEKTVDETEFLVQVCRKYQREGRGA